MRYGATTRLTPERVIEKAKEFFGKTGMQVQSEGANALRMSADEGFVELTMENASGTELEIETKGFDPQVKQFIQRIG